MTEFSQTVIALTIYRLFTVLIGLSFAFLGYKLFCHGIYDKAGDLKATLGERYIILKEAAPGTFFALFGVVVISISLWRGIEIDINRTKTAIPNSSQSSRGNVFASPQLDSNILSIIEKTFKGQNLKENERKLLNQWLELEKEHIHFRAQQPELPIPKVAGDNS